MRLVLNPRESSAVFFPKNGFKFAEELATHHQDREGGGAGMGDGSWKGERCWYAIDYKVGVENAHRHT